MDGLSHHIRQDTDKIGRNPTNQFATKKQERKLPRFLESKRSCSIVLELVLKSHKPIDYIPREEGVVCVLLSVKSDSKQP